MPYNKVGFELWNRGCVPEYEMMEWANVLALSSLCFKGQCHEIFCFWFFSMNQFPPAPEYPISTVTNFFQSSRRYSQVKVHHRYQQHRWQICHRCHRHWRPNCHRYHQHRQQICHQYQRHRWQILPPVSLVLLIPVSTIPAANNGNNIRLQIP